MFLRGGEIFYPSGGNHFGMMEPRCDRAAADQFNLEKSSYLNRLQR